MPDKFIGYYRLTCSFGWLYPSCLSFKIVHPVNELYAIQWEDNSDPVTYPTCINIFIVNPGIHQKCKLYSWTQFCFHILAIIRGLPKLALIIIGSHLKSAAGWRPPPCYATQCDILPVYHFIEMFVALAHRFFLGLPWFQLPWPSFHIKRSCAQLSFVRATCPAHLHFCFMMVVNNSRRLDFSFTVLLDKWSCHNSNWLTVAFYFSVWNDERKGFVSLKAWLHWMSVSESCIGAWDILTQSMKNGPRLKTDQQTSQSRESNSAVIDNHQ